MFLKIVVQGYLLIFERFFN